ncbi:MAG: hypothetical protein HYS22_03335 [Deltaproteobacteria bacterium]|nr:hypothetical protein [Deltaproteobacteria bacterium]
MSLKAFHIIFITISALLAIGLTFFGLRGPHYLFAVGCGLLLALIPYSFWFIKKTRKMMALLLIGSSLLVPVPVWACTVCLGDPDSPLSKGAKMGVLVLVGVVLFVLGGISGVAFSWWRRSRAK